MYYIYLLRTGHLYQRIAQKPRNWEIIVFTENNETELWEEEREKVPVIQQNDCEAQLSSFFLNLQLSMSIILLKLAATSVVKGAKGVGCFDARCLDVMIMT